MSLRHVPLRRRLFLLAAAGIVPLALSAGLSLLALVAQQREEMRSAATDISRALAIAVDSELHRAEAVLEVMGTSTELQNDDPRAFQSRAQRVLSSQKDWVLVMLADPIGQVLMSTSVSFEQPKPQIVDRASFVHAVREHKPVVGQLAPGPKGSYAFAVRVPVKKEGQLRYVLSSALRPQAVLDVVKRQQVPAGWVVSVFDATGHRVARSHDHERSIGQPATPSLQKLLASRAEEGAGLSTSLEGEQVYTTFTRLKDSGWTVVIHIPAADLTAGAYGSLMGYGGGILLSLIGATLAALAVARSINRPIGQLRQVAQALGEGAPPQRVSSDIQEVQAVADALLAAAAQRATNEAERESLLDAERRSRAAVEAARRRLELLATAGSVLSGSLEPHATLEAIASIMVPSLADWCRIDLIDSDGNLQQVLMHHANPERAREGAELIRQMPARPDVRGSLAWAAAHGKPHRWLVERDDPARAIRDPMLLRFVQVIGLRVSFVVPLIARGRTLGALAALQGESGRDLNDDDCALIAQLAQRAALALDNARLYAEAEAARTQAETANRAKDEFLAMLGHELRNPLAPIVTALHLMGKREADTTARERGIIERQVSHLMRLVDDLLDVSRITQGKIQLQLAPVDLAAVVARALELTQPVFEKRARRVEVSLPDEPVQVMGDAVRLTQVLCNLLTNAAKFTPSAGRIALCVRQVQDQAEILVEDSGSGMSPDLLPHVFDLFTQGQQAIDRHAGGLGLGLAIVKTLVQMHGGSVTAASEGPGRGSRISVRLPAGVAAQPQAEPAHPALALPRGSGRILVVDDNADAAHTVAELLDSEGYETRVCGDGPAALALLNDFHPELMLLDIGLPGMDGYDLARRLRADPRTSQAHLIALTGYGSARDRELARAAGFDEHLVKPVSPQQLLAALASWLGRRA